MYPHREAFLEHSSLHFAFKNNPLLVFTILRVFGIGHGIC